MNNLAFQDFIDTQYEVIVEKPTILFATAKHIFRDVSTRFPPEHGLRPDGDCPVDIFSPFPWTWVKRHDWAKNKYRIWADSLHKAGIKPKPMKYVGDIHQIYGVNLQNWCKDNIVFVSEQIDKNHLIARYMAQLS